MKKNNLILMAAVVLGSALLAYSFSYAADDMMKDAMTDVKEKAAAMTDSAKEAMSATATEAKQAGDAMMAKAENTVDASGKYDIDLAHSSIGFGVKHLTVSTTWGSFKDFTGAIEYNPSDATPFKANVTIQVASIDTRNADRDKHLKSADFFDAEKFPTITFQSKTLTATETGGYILVGDLTIRDVTKEVSIPVTLNGPVKSPFGDTAIGLSGQYMINRQDYGVKWSKTLDSGGLVVADEVGIAFEIEAHKK